MPKQKPRILRGSGGELHLGIGIAGSRSFKQNPAVSRGAELAASHEHAEFLQEAMGRQARGRRENKSILGSIISFPFKLLFGGFFSLFRKSKPR